MRDHPDESSRSVLFSQDQTTVLQPSVTQSGSAVRYNAVQFSTLVPFLLQTLWFVGAVL